VPQQEQDGDTTTWYLSFWSFCSQYLNERFGDDYCLGPEQSLVLHVGNESVPQQLLVRSSSGNNVPTELLFGTSVFPLNSPLPSKARIEIYNGLRIMDLPSSIVYCDHSAFKRRPVEMRTALSLIQDASELLDILLDGGHTKIAGRLVGAYRNLGRDRIADDLFKTMRTAGYDVRELDPFENPSSVHLNESRKSPPVNRIKLMWEDLRSEVIEVFPKSAGLISDKQAYLNQIEELYKTDAYHSLSIERYLVTPELIERIRSGRWDIETSEEDRKQKDAMAAKGYLMAFHEVKESIRMILEGASATGKTVLALNFAYDLYKQGEKHIYYFDCDKQRDFDESKLINDIHSVKGKIKYKIM
jgi:hypothetical protein